MTEQEIDDFILKYRDDRLANNKLFIDYASRSFSNKYRYEDIIKIVDIKDGIQLDHKCSLDYTRIEDVGSQRLFDSLFEKSLFSDLISDLVNLTYLDIEYSNLREVDYRILQERYDLKRIVWRISNVKFENRKVKSFMDNVNWEHFSIAFYIRFN